MLAQSLLPGKCTLLFEQIRSRNVPFSCHFSQEGSGISSAFEEIKYSHNFCSNNRQSTRWSHSGYFLISFANSNRKLDNSIAYFYQPSPREKNSIEFSYSIQIMFPHFFSPRTLDVLFAGGKKSLLEISSSRVKKFERMNNMAKLIQYCKYISRPLVYFCTIIFSNLKKLYV